MIKNTIIFLFVLLFGLLSQAQNTVGILSQQLDEVYEGYNLLYPHNQSTVYLIDNCGQIVHTWEDAMDFRPGNAVYLLENGNIVKCKRAATSGPNDPIWAGGAGEMVEIRTWNNELLDSYSLNKENFRLHHDVEPLPNGNILMIAWETKTYEEALAAGRNPDLLADNRLFSEVLLEWDPISDSIVWEWHAWDHLVQNYDATKANFGNPFDSPQYINLNYDEHDGHPDWLHFNSIDYNSVLDQIVVSVPYFNEFWIIDHDITTQEAASEKGDLLYRWGNPITYNDSTTFAKHLFFQHDVNWINPNAPIGSTDFGKLSLFNNRIETNISTANIIATTHDGTYQIGNTDTEFNTFERIAQYPETIPRAASASVSSAQVLPNGNILLLSGRWGFAYELSATNEVLWEYIVPLRAGQTVAQGEDLTIGNNFTFRMTRYGLDYPAFEGKDLSPKAYWELNPNEGFCGIVDVEETTTEAAFKLYPNPVNENLHIELDKPTRISIYSALGVKQQALDLQQGTHTLHTSSWKPGLYFLSSENGQVQKVLVQ